VKGLGFRVQDEEFRVKGSRLRFYTRVKEFGSQL
jgi:hypothetical protein